MLSLLLYIINWAVVFGLALYVVRELVEDATIKKVARVVITVLACVVLICLLLNFLPGLGTSRPFLR